jgi:hypothetical protein
MNRALRMQHLRRCALKNTRGGGLNVDPSASFSTANGVLIPENLATSECYDLARPGALPMEANPELAQVAMAGGDYSTPRSNMSAAGGRRKSRKSRKSRKNRSTRKRGGACPCAFAGRRVSGGSRKSRKSRNARKSQRKTRKQRGGRYEVDVSMSVGGDGPVAAPVYARVPCDPQAGSSGPFYVPLAQDPRAPTDLYSATPNQTGGAAYPPSCYRAPGSEMPVYQAESAGFRFEPSTGAGATLPDGVTAYNNVVPYAARMGGAIRRTRRSRR